MFALLPPGLQAKFHPQGFFVLCFSSKGLPSVEWGKLVGRINRENNETTSGKEKFMQMTSIFVMFFSICRDSDIQISCLKGREKTAYFHAQYIKLLVCASEHLKHTNKTN